jgi:carbon storage regulator CsrA
MLSLTRKTGEQIQIHSDITITVVQIANGRVSIGIEAPRHIRVMRGELAEQMDEGPAIPAAGSVAAAVTAPVAASASRSGRPSAGRRSVGNPARRNLVSATGKKSRR